MFNRFVYIQAFVKLDDIILFKVSYLTPTHQMPVIYIKEKTFFLCLSQKQVKIFKIF